RAFYRHVANNCRTMHWRLQQDHPGPCRSRRQSDPEKEWLTSYRFPLLYTAYNRAIKQPLSQFESFLCWPLYTLTSPRARSMQALAVRDVRQSNSVYILMTPLIVPDSLILVVPVGQFDLSKWEIDLICLIS